MLMKILHFMILVWVIDLSERWLQNGEMDDVTKMLLNSDFRSKVSLTPLRAIICILISTLVVHFTVFTN